MHRAAPERALDAELIAAWLPRSITADRARSATGRNGRLSDLPRADRGGHRRFKTRLEHIGDLVGSGCQQRHCGEGGGRPQIRGRQRLRAASSPAVRSGASPPGIGERTALAPYPLPNSAEIFRAEPRPRRPGSLRDDSGEHKPTPHRPRPQPLAPIPVGRGFLVGLELEHRADRALCPAHRTGKAHNAALIACARKLLIYANTVSSADTPWTEQPLN